MAWNAAEQSGYQSTYGAGLGGIQSYGYGNPYGPYAGLQKPPGLGGSASSSSASTNPANSAAMNFLNSIVSGTQLPYSQQQQDAQFGQASGINAAAEANQNQQTNDAAAASGASPTDPSLQNQYRQNAARRQTGNQRAMGEIQSKAGSENFGAQMGAASELLGEDRFNRELSQRQSGQAMDMLAKRYSGGGGGGGGRQSSGGNNFNLSQTAHTNAMNQQLDDEEYMASGRQSYANRLRY